MYCFSRYQYCVSLIAKEEMFAKQQQQNIHTPKKTLKDI